MPADEAWRRTIAAMHASGRQAALAITGGGSGAIAELLRVPGGSRLLLEAIVPYDMRALSAFLGAEPAQACSAETAAGDGPARARACRNVRADGRRPRRTRRDGEPRERSTEAG